MWWPFTLLVLPLIWVSIDAVAGVRAHRYSQVHYEPCEWLDDFEVLVPLYGDVRYFENADYLAPYGSQVILCTTSGETNQFYQQLAQVADRYGFRIFLSSHVARPSRRRRTGGTIRDTVIRDALIDEVRAEYVICLDADTTTPVPLNSLVGQVHSEQGDVASITLVPQTKGPWLVQLQRFEFRQAMRLRFVLPWLVSGACHAGRSDAMREVMRRHSLFFQGNDVETGLLAEQLGYRVLHIPFEVNTNVPDTVRSWWRQRLAWAGGEFRLFIANIRLFLRHPWFWFYGAGLAFSLVAFRWYALMRPDWALVLAFVMYCALTYSLHWRERNRWLVLLPLYTLFHSMVLVVLGVFWYFVMAVPEHNYGIIRPTRGSRMDALVSGWSQASRRPGRPVRR